MSHDLMVGLAIGVFAGMGGFFSRSSASNDQVRLVRLEAKLNLLLDRFGIEHDVPSSVHDTPSEEVRDWILKGRKINAIRAYKVQNPGVGLKEAKDIVEALEQQMKAGISH